MSLHPFLAKLLDGAEVAWKPLGEVLTRTTGTKITAAQMRELHRDGAPLKVFAGGKTVAFVDFGDIPEKDINYEPSIIVKSRGVIEFEYYDKPFSHKNEMWSYNAKGKTINIKYVYHFLKLNEPHFQCIGSKMQMPQIAIPDTDKFPIPIPCPNNPAKSLAIQGEIVRILDAFTAMTAELTAELNMRKKQYNYYRDWLLRFTTPPYGHPSTGGELNSPSLKGWQAKPDGVVPVEWKTLGEVAEIQRGKRLVKRQLEVKGDFPVYQNCMTPLGYYHESNAGAGTTFIISAGAAGEIGYSDVDFWAADDVYYFVTSEEINSKFIYYFLLTQQEKIKSQVRRASVPRLSKSAFDKLKIPIPPLAEQARIVAILDKFDALTNSITEGLPREIELRQKQYEYYRDLLLGFPKPEEGTGGQG